MEQDDSPLTFADAARFWGIDENTCAEEIDTKLDRVVNDLVALGEQIAATGSLVVGGRTVTGADLAMLAKVNRHLKERFERHLRIFRRRRPPDR